MNIKRTLLTLTVFTFALFAGSQLASAQDYSMGGGLFGLEPSDHYSSSNSGRSTSTASSTGNYRYNPGYQVQPAKSWKMVWSTTAYADQAWGMQNQLQAQGYTVQTRQRTIPYAGRYVYVVDIYCYLYQ